MLYYKSTQIETNNSKAHKTNIFILLKYMKKIRKKIKIKKNHKSEIKIFFINYNTIYNNIHHFLFYSKKIPQNICINIK